MKRFLTAALLAPAVFYVVEWSPQWLFWLALALVAGACFYEYSGIVAAQGIERPGVLGYGAGVVLLWMRHSELMFLLILALSVLALAMRFRDLAKALPYAAALVLGVLYTYGPWRVAGLLRSISPHWLLFALALTWIGDAAAYYAGTRFGRHRLAPAISPKKSVEGSLASLAASVVFGVWFLHRCLPAVSLPEAVVLSIWANVAGQIGDLAESALKRGAGIKDSGNTLPGHGGWLDRVDSSLFAIPAVYLYLQQPWSSLLPGALQP